MHSFSQGCSSPPRIPPALLLMNSLAAWPSLLACPHLLPLSPLLSNPRYTASVPPDMPGLFLLFLLCTNHSCCPEYLPRPLPDVPDSLSIRSLHQCCFLRPLVPENHSILKSHPSLSHSSFRFCYELISI